MNLNVMTVQDAARIAERVKSTQKDAEAIAAEGQSRPTGTTPQVSADDLYTQIVKFIPTPLIGFYLLIVNVLVGSIGDDHEGARQFWCLVTLILFLALVVAFLITRKVRRPVQIVASVLAFAAWASASPGYFQQIDGYPEWLGTIALSVILVFFVVFQVKPLPDSVIDDSAP